RRENRMIILPIDDQLRIVTQNDHAAFAGELLSLWRADGVPTNPRRDALLVAAREHDNGWREVDSAPHAREDGKPHDFRSLPQPLRRELWRRGVERFAERDPVAALLILEHAIALHLDRLDDPEWAALVETWRQQRDAWRDALGLDAETLRADYRFIDLTDVLSLAVCAGWSEPFDTSGPRAAVRTIDATTAELLLDPLPLAGATSFDVACRFIEDRPFSGDADLAIELASARWTSIRVRVGGSNSVSLSN
ncbi:MAG: DUF3891 family protein, partial [Acidobacteriota bacterium]